MHFSVTCNLPEIIYIWIYKVLEERYTSRFQLFLQKERDFIPYVIHTNRCSNVRVCTACPVNWRDLYILWHVIQILAKI